MTGLMTFLKVMYGLGLVFLPLWLAILFAWILGDE